MINYLIEVLNAIWEWNAALTPHHGGHVNIALPPLIVAGVIAAGAAYKASSDAKQRKRAFGAQKKLDYNEKVRNGALALNASEQYALPEYDDDPFTNNERRLYGGGDSDVAASSTASSSSSSADGYSAIANALIGMYSTSQDNKAQKRELAYQVNKTPLNNDFSRFSMDTQRDASVQQRQLLNDPYRYAFGGAVNQQSSNTAVVMAGTHESGDDMPFFRPDGTKAAVEGGEGLMKQGSQVSVYSDRIKVPGEDVTIAAKFRDLSSLKGNLEKDAKVTGNAITANTANRKVEGINQSLTSLLNVQEGIKKAMGRTQANNAQYALGDEDALYEQAGEFKSPSYELTMKKLGVNPNAPHQPKVSAGRTLMNTLKTDGALNGITTGLTLLDNIYNNGIIKKMDDNDVRYVNPVELDKEYDVSAQEHSVKKELDNFYKNVDKNTTSSVVGLNVKLAAMAEGVDKLNQVYDTKEKFETEMRNKEILVNSQIETGNVDIYNRSTLRDQENLRARSANFSNAIDDVVNGMIRGQGIRTNKDRFNVQEQSIADTGVIVGNLRNGGYKDMGADRIGTLIDQAIKGGFLTYDRYVNDVNDHNAKAAAGSKLKVMTKGEFLAKGGKPQ